MPNAALNVTNYRKDEALKAKLVHRHTGVGGMVEHPIHLENENTLVSVSAVGYQSWSEEFKLNCSQGGCPGCVRTKMIKLITIVENAKGAVAIYEVTTNTSIEGVVINVYGLALDCEVMDSANMNITTNNDTRCVETKIAENLPTNSQGVAEFPLQPDYQYIVRTAEHPHFISSTTTGALRCDKADCDSCRLVMHMALARPGCHNASLHIHVRDFVTDEVIPGTSVDIFAGCGTKIDTLVSNDMGEVKYDVPDNGEYSVVVSVAGMVTVEESSLTRCNVTDCSSCATLVKFRLPPTVGTPVCDNTTLTVRVLDSSTRQVITERVRLSLEYSPNNTDADTLITHNVTSLIRFPITENGEYYISAWADGYTEATAHAVYNCSLDDCHSDCSQVVNITLHLHYCEATYINYTVRDHTFLKITVREENIPVAGATAWLYKIINWGGIWNFVMEDSAASGVSCENGVIFLKVNARADYNVLIRKKGYMGLRYTTQVMCKSGMACDECKPALDVELEEKFCNATVKLIVTVTDEQLFPIENAAVNFISKSSQNGFHSQVVEAPLLTNASGIANQIIHRFGIFTVNVSATGFLPMSKDVLFYDCSSLPVSRSLFPVSSSLLPVSRILQPASKSSISAPIPPTVAPCDEILIRVALALPKIDQPFCENSFLAVTVSDQHTSDKLSNAIVLIKLKVGKDPKFVNSEW